MADHGWRVERCCGVELVRSVALDAVAGVEHAFSTAVDAGGRSFDGASDEGRRALAHAAGLGSCRPSAQRQVHGNRVIDAAAPVDPADDPPRADAVVARRAPGESAVPSVRTADCVPVLIAERDGAALAAVHSGWRGTAADVAGAAVAALERAGCAPQRLVVAIGPSIGSCCYPVGGDVVAAVACGSGLAEGAIRRGADRLDLAAAVSAQLIRAGVPAGAVSAAPWCTFCAVEPSFHSYRRKGALAGRSVALIGWARAGLP